jgi:hypothetical protein
MSTHRLAHNLPAFMQPINPATFSVPTGYALKEMPFTVAVPEDLKHVTAELTKELVEAQLPQNFTFVALLRIQPISSSTILVDLQVLSRSVI